MCTLEELDTFHQRVKGDMARQQAESSLASYIKQSWPSIEPWTPERQCCNVAMLDTSDHVAYNSH